MRTRFLARTFWLGLGIVAVPSFLAFSDTDPRPPRPRVVRPSGVSLLVPAARQKPGRVRQRVVERDAARAPFAPSLRRRGPGVETPLVQHEVQPPAAPIVERVWLRRYRDVQGNIDRANDMVVAPDGTVYVTGLSIDDATGSDVITIKYSTDGSAQWRRRYHFEPGSLESGEGVAVDRLGNVYVAGTLNYYLQFHQYLLLKYAPDGRLLWARRIPSEELGGWGNSMALHVVVDPFDDVYLTGRGGSPRTAGSGYDVVTLKLDPDGNAIWRHRYAGISAGGWGEEPERTVLDPFGNLLVGGEGPGRAGDADGFVVKIDPEGSLVWHRHHRGAGGGRDEVHDLAVDGTGHVVVTGERVRLRGDSDIFAVKYSPLGTVEWHARYDGPFHDADAARAVALGDDGSVFLTGYTWGGEFSDGGTTYDAVTIKLDSDGHRLWSRVISSANRWFDWGAAALAAADGGVYVGGATQGAPGGFDDFMVLRYSASGEVLWKHLYNGSGGNTDSVSFLGGDDRGGLYATGRSQGRSGSDFVTAKYVEH